MLTRAQKLLSLHSKFDYDWNQSQTAAPNLSLIPEIESFLQEIPDGFIFDDVEHNKAYYQLLYKLSTYYLHYARDHKNALKRLTVAENLHKKLSFLNAEEMASLYNDLAYAYQIKMQKEGHKKDTDIVFGYCNQVIEQEEKVGTKAYGKKAAYAKIVIGHIYRDNGEFGTAERYYRAALTFYESIDSLDEQYIRLKNTLAQVVNAQRDRTREAGEIFEEISEYWSKRDCSRNHYAANHFLAYANYCCKNENYPQAAKLLDKVVGIYNQTHTKDHVDYFVFADLPKLAQAVYEKLPEQEKASYAGLNEYVYNLKHPKLGLMKMPKRPNPRIIPSHFRLQPCIDEELTKATALLEEKKLDSADYVDIGLAFLEIGDWPSVIKYSLEALKLEEEKTLDKRSNEIIASAHYMIATQKRELNDCDGALSQYTIAIGLAQSPWLKSNLLRNMGLVHLKKQDYIAAAKIFKEAFDFTNQESNLELRGSLPALYNYYGLSLIKAALKSNQDPAVGIKVLEETTQLYKAIFKEKNIIEAGQRRSHDWQSHQFHRGMILCELAEKHYKHTEDDKSSADYQNMFRNAEELLLGALAGRKENKADDQRLGDVYVWLGRTAVGLKNIKMATEYFERALVHYKKAFPTAPEPSAQDANQIKDVRSRLAELRKLNKSERNLFEFWSTNRKAIAAGVVIAAVGVAAVYALRRK